MARLAFRNLGQGKARLVISVGGTALALLLILALDAILAGFQRQVSAYIDNSGADVVISQRDVRNMHMASSSLPAGIVRRVERVPGVAQVTPFLYMTNLVGAGEKRELAYVIGLPRDASMGIPWKDVRGTRVPGRGQAVLDSGAAAALGVRSGGRIQILGHSFRVAGLAGGYSSPVSTIVFISLRDFERLRGASGTVSFVWVRGGPGGRAQCGGRGLRSGYEWGGERHQDCYRPCRADGHQLGHEPARPTLLWSWGPKR